MTVGKKLLYIFTTHPPRWDCSILIECPPHISHPFRSGDSWPNNTDFILKECTVWQSNRGMWTNFKWHLEVNTRRDVYRLPEGDRGISLSWREMAWEEARKDFTDEVWFRDLKGDYEFIKHSRYGEYCVQKCRHPFIQETYTGAFTMSHELCQVGSWLLRWKHHDPCMDPHVGDIENHGLFVMPGT